MMASWLVHWPQNPVVLDQTLFMDIMLCSWARQFTLSASLDPGV